MLGSYEPFWDELSVGDTNSDFGLFSVKSEMELAPEVDLRTQLGKGLSRSLPNF